MDAFVGEIKLWPMSWAPEGWVICNGQELKVAKHPALFFLLNNNYGGDGIEGFKVPDLRGRTAIGATDSRYDSNEGLPALSLGQTTGTEPAETNNSNGHRGCLVVNFIICAEGTFPQRK